MGPQVIDCQQGEPEWYAARLGLPTASAFSTILAKGEGKTRRTYLLKLAGEILTGEPMETYSNEHMERGKEWEAEARTAYEIIKGVDAQQVGFIVNGDKGCSPDALLGDDGGLEIKTALPHIQIDRLLRGELPSEHRAQVQGSIWITERAHWDFVSYCRGLPPLIVRVPRDDGYIAVLAGAVKLFNDELAATVKIIREYQTGTSSLLEDLKASA